MDKLCIEKDRGILLSGLSRSFCIHGRLDGKAEGIAKQNRGNEFAESRLRNKCCRIVFCYDCCYVETGVKAL